MAQSLNIELPYDTRKHRDLKDAVWARYKMSQDRMSTFHTQWKESEELMQSYIPETENDAIRRGLRESGKPQYTTLVVPQTYAMVMTAHTYLVNVFLSRDPVFQFAARHGEPQMQVMAMEALISYQVLVGRLLAPLFIWLLDPLKYGFGAMGMYWDEEMVQSSQIIEVPKMYLGMPIPGTKQKKRVVRTIPSYQGNKLYNIRPYDFYPDPRVPLCRLQEGEFCAVTQEVAWTQILRGEAKGKYINIKALKTLAARTADKESNYEGSSQNEMPGENTDILAPIDLKDVGYVTLIHMYIDLVPSDWGLGVKKTPEKWIFTLANREVLIEAKPAGELHGRFPFFVEEYEVNGYELASRGMTTIGKPLNDVLTWLINTHFHSVRKTLNDQLVYDPSRIVTKDLTDPNPGRLIRLRPGAYGTNPADAIVQLQTADVTQGHLRDAQLVMEMMQRMLGVNDSLMGAQTGSSRKTATEIRTSSSFSINRLKTTAEYQSASAWEMLSQTMVQNTQQFYSNDQIYKVAGDALSGVKTMQVTPDMITGFYDFVPVDGTMPVDKFALANLWKEIMAGVAKIPGLMQQYDIGKIFSYTAKLSGARNIDQFKIQVMPDQAVMDQANAGNVVPLGGGSEPRGSAREPASQEIAASRPPNVGQIPGLGPTG